MGTRFNTGTFWDENMDSSQIFYKETCRLGLDWLWSSWRLEICGILGPRDDKSCRFGLLRYWPNLSLCFHHTGE